MAEDVEGERRAAGSRTVSSLSASAGVAREARAHIVVLARRGVERDGHPQRSALRVARAAAEPARRRVVGVQVALSEAHGGRTGGGRAAGAERQRARERPYRRPIGRPSGRSRGVHGASLIETGGGTGAQGGHQALQTRATSECVRVVEPAAQRRGGGRGDGVALPAQGVKALGEAAPLAPGGELGEGGVQRRGQLQAASRIRPASRSPGAEV